MPRGAGEIEANGFVHLGLHRAGNNLFHRVFDGDDLASTGFDEMAEAGINRSGLAAASRTGEEQQAGGLAKKLFQFGDRDGGQGQFAERYGRGRIEKPQDNFFPGHGRISGHADVVFAAEVVARNATVLRQRILIRLQPRQEFDPAKDAIRHVGRKFSAGSDDAIKAETDLGGLAAHLEVDIARAGAFGLMDQLLQNFRCIAVLVFLNHHGLSKGCSNRWTRPLQFRYTTNLTGRFQNASDCHRTSLP